jgi:hypothetical protein
MRKLRLLKAKARRKPTDPESQRLASLTEPKRAVCATCSGVTKPKCEREAAMWCNAVVELGARAVEKGGLRHLEVWELPHEYSEFEEPFDAGMLVGMRDELVREAAGE